MTQILLELASFRKNLSQLDLTFYSRLVSLLLATSRIDYYVKFFKSKFFSKKSDFGRFWLKIGDKYIIYSTGWGDQHIQNWVKSNYLVMSCYGFHKSWFSVWNAYFSVKIIHISLNFHFFSFSPNIFKVFTKFVFLSNLDLFWMK